ncbi:MAG TPA: translation initiation factor IF-2 [Candidatus Dormibacteraeota bacterium]|nr:translation initiation factor IF-2 [Candidatus Dormibacteraeota bacterium]
MTDSNQIRINELARELEVKAKAILDYLPEAGVSEKKTHSSSIEVEAAVKVREHFRQVAEAEASAEAAAAAAEKASKEAATRAARARAAAPPAPVAAPIVPTKPPAPATGGVIAEKPAAVSGPSAVPAIPAKPSVPAQSPASTAAPKPAGSPAAPSGMKSPAPAVRAPVAPGQQPALSAARTSAAPPASAAAKPATTPAAAPKAPLRRYAGNPIPPGARPNPPAASPTAQTSPSRSSQPVYQRPGQPATRPGQPGASGPPARHPRPGAPAGSGRPIQGRPGQPMPSRPGSRPTRPGQMAPPPPPLPTKVEPGKPIYARKPPPRARPVMDKREAEGERKLHPVRARPGVVDRRPGHTVPAAIPVPREPREVTITEGVTVRDLAEKLDVRAKDVLKILMDRGIFASINQALDTPTATTLAEAFNGVVKVISFEEEVVLDVAKEEKLENLSPRAPVVTVMGHVDHGKTSLLDAIRETEVAAGEAGGITQHIGAYQVTVDHKRVVFVDTPGHEAFTRMRARGAKVTDIVVLVVGADDGVMPQTQEAIDHAKAAGVPIVVAINKIDKPEAEPERVKRQLADRGLMPEEWGGDTVMVEVSAKQKTNLNKLLEMLLLVADMRELKANPKAPATGTVLESRVDKGRGPVATVLVQNGTLHAGDFFICGAVFGKVRALFDDKGRTVKEAAPATPVEVLGLQGIPEAGDHFQVTDEAKARHIVEYRQSKLREASLARSAGSRITLDQLHEQLKAGDVKELPIVIKADVQGSVEVLSEMLPKLSTDQVKLKILHASVGAVTETDVLLASASSAIIIAFGVRPERKAADLAQQEKVEIRTHSIIYEVSDEIKKAMEGLLEPVFQETYMGRAEVRNTFRIKGTGMIAGCYVLDGVLKRDGQIRVVRDSVVIYTAKLSSLRRFKDDASEVRSGFECGASISNFNDVKVGDILECFQVQKLTAAEAALPSAGSRT